MGAHGWRGADVIWPLCLGNDLGVSHHDWGPQMKPKPFKIFSCSEANPDRDHWVYKMEIGNDEHASPEHERRAVLMRHAPELLNELKAAFELLMQVLDHQRDGKPLPTQAAVRHVALDAWNVIDLAEGRKTEGTRFYPAED
jgi:hypothetical protein